MAKARQKYTANNNKELSHIREDLESLRQNMVSLTHSVRQDVKDSALTRWDHLREQGEHTVERMEGHVREHPAQSLLTAFGAGLLLSALMRGR